MPTKEDFELPDELSRLQVRGDGYRPPGPDYFASLADKALSEARPPTRVRRLPRRWLAVAASFLLLLAAGWFLLSGLNTSGADQLAEKTTTVSAEELLADIDPELLDDYIDEHLEDFETELYADYSEN